MSDFPNLPQACPLLECDANRAEPSHRRPPSRGRRQRSLDLRLAWAAENGNRAELRAMIRKGASATSLNSWGQTSLMRAATLGHAPCVELLAPLSEPDELGHLGDTALGMAARHGHADCVAILLNYCSPNGGGRFWNTPLLASISGKHLECATLILAAPGLLLSDPYGDSALAAAAAKGFHEAVAALVPMSDPLAHGVRSLTPLMFASLHGQILCAELLAPYSDLSALDDEGSTARDIALRKGFGDLAAMLASFAERQELTKSSASDACYAKKSISL